MVKSNDQMRYAQVGMHVAFPRKHLVADGAFRLATMHFHVMTQRGAQCERLATNRARKTARRRRALRPATDCSAAYRQKKENSRQPENRLNALLTVGGLRKIRTERVEHDDLWGDGGGRREVTCTETNVPVVNCSGVARVFVGGGETFREPG